MSLKRSHSQWPEGIPSVIRRHEEHVDWDSLGATTRAWRYFARERWVGGDTADQQKRDLIEEWATADQEFRDGYQSRAPEDEPSYFEGPELKDESFIRSDVEGSCMVYIYITELNEGKQALLTKCNLGLFPWEDGWEFLASGIVMFLPLGGNQGDILDTFQLQQSVARPDFLDMHMALDETVLFRDCYRKPIIDDRTLETELGLWVQFETNGIYKTAYWAQIMSAEHAEYYRDIGPGNQRDPKFILEGEPVDMRKPLVEIYQGDEVD
ncbi:uncharacterized protein N7503_005819 [Penicillium pulvis]|uniref:uncharacterized protein n=1 Tax=Penicillium pulvis TaxID=1562058 RepID=UPI002548DF84|nr:uncharacterized protein N7503_005819 [Penicillium pulvis]KAJ5803369.1 hypothetical protein N7503_005819 [Penicillium pulvis]KAJ6105221.1 hypothetical protein N7523_010031 [Penicillium sp. IBT 18751x]